MKKVVNAIRFSVALTIVMIVCSTVPAQGTPQSPLPTPTGPYSVGRTEFDWIDSMRLEPENPSGHRGVVVCIWYPAASPPAGAETAVWIPGILGELSLAEHMNKMAKAAQGNPYPVETIHTHAYVDAPLTAGSKRFPVLLFEPGNGELPYTYATLLEDVASHGYIVVGLVPSYYHQFTVLANGRIVTPKKQEAPDNLSSPLLTAPEKRTSEIQQEVRLSNGSAIYLSPALANAYQAKEIYEMAGDDWVVDMGFILDQLEKLDSDAKSQFSGRLDLKKVGTFGHSRGGAASLQMAKEDSRVVAAINLDGSRGEVNQDGGVFKPVMVIEHLDQVASSTSAEINQKRNAHYTGVLRDGKPSYHVSIPNSTHGYSMDFGFMPFVPQSAKAKMLGPIDPARALTITKVYVEAFFGEYLEGKKTPLLNGPSPEYSEITFETNKK